MARICEVVPELPSQIRSRHTTRIPPLIQTPPDLTCSVPSAGDSLYVRFQAGPVIANMLPAEEDRIRLRDCLASTAAQDQEIDAGAFHPASGIPRPIVTNVFNRDAISGALECSGYAGPGFAALLNNVTDFKVFYKFDARGYSIGFGQFLQSGSDGRFSRRCSVYQRIARPG